jgi:hypothetical protein
LEDLQSGKIASEENLSDELNHKLANHRRQSSEAEKGFRRELFTQLVHWGCQINGDEDGKGQEQILV